MVLKQKGAPPLSLVVAVIAIYKRLIAVWALPPILIFAGPIVLGILLSALNAISNGHGALLLILSLVAVFVVRRAICRYAPSPKSRDDALAQSRLVLPLLSATFVFLFIRFVVSPIESAMGLKQIFTSTPGIPYLAALRLAAGMAVLGLVVMARFIGPTSIVRYSSVPLVSNPLTSSIRSAWARCTSLDAVLDFIAGPSDTPGDLIKPSFSSYHGRGRRYQWPPFRMLFAQLLSAVLGGTAVAYLTVLGWYKTPHNQAEHTDPFVKTCLVVTCAMTSIVQLWLTKSHELDPKHYRFKTGHLLLATVLHSNIWNFVLSITLVPIFSIGVVFLATDESLGDTRTGDLFALALVCLLAASVVSFYLTAIDEAARMVLFVPGPKLTRLVGEICNDVSPYLCLDVMLNNVLQGDVKFVLEIWTPTEKPDMEEEEMRRNDTCIEQMAHILLHSGRGGEEACLEQDVLRVSLLESLGGDRNAATSILSIASPRHAENVRYWVETGNSVEARWEPVAVPLVRGLCAYVGGLGEALLCCTQSIAFSHNPQTTPWQMEPNTLSSPSDHFSRVTWSLPPGAIACAEYAVTGAARCIVWDMNVSRKAMANWRSSHLSMLVPAVLHSAFRLRCGIFSYAKYIQSDQTVTDNGEQINWIVAHNPELRPLLSACDEAALSILATLKSVGGMRNVDVQVQSGCRDWLRQLQGRPP